MADQDTLKEFPLLIRINDQSGGMNTRTFATEIGDNQAQLLNDYFVERGLIKKRDGTTSFSSQATALPTRGIINFNPDDGSTNVIMFASGDEVNTVISDGTTSLRATTPTPGLETEFIQGLNKVFMCNGSDDPLVFDTSLAFSTIASTATAFSKFTTGVYFLNRIWTNDVSNKAHVRYTDTLTDIFNSTDLSRTFRFGEGSGNSEVVKIKGYRNQELLVFMNNRIEELQVVDPTDNTTWVRRVIDERYGLVAKDSVVEIGGVIYFLDNERRVRAFDRTALDAPIGTQAIPISNNITDEIDSINNLQISKASAGAFRNFYLLAIPKDSSTENDVIFVFDVNLGSWMGPWNLAAGKFVASGVRGRGEELYFGSSSVGKVIRMFDGTKDDDGAAIETIWISKKYNFNRPESDKTFAWVEVTVLGTGEGTVTLDARVDSADFSNVGNFDIVSGSPSLPVNFPIQLGATGLVHGKFHLEGFSRGRQIDFRVTHNETTDIQILEMKVAVLDENVEDENI